MFCLRVVYLAAAEWGTIRGGLGRHGMGSVWFGRRGIDYEGSGRVGERALIGADLTRKRTFLE